CQLSCAHSLSCLSLDPALLSPDLHPFPTRRSSDLAHLRSAEVPDGRLQRLQRLLGGPVQRPAGQRTQRLFAVCRCLRRAAEPPRSEEHTSELQSRENLVCRLLLEKKNERRIRCVLV